MPSKRITPPVASIHFSGTWQTYVNPECGRPRTHISRLHDAFPEPKFHVEGVGERFDEVGRILGGVSGVGVAERVDDAIDWLSTHQAKKRVATSHSRGCYVLLRTLKRLEGIRTQYEKGLILDAAGAALPPPPWTYIDAAVMLDPVFSVGLSGIFKAIGAAIDYALPGRPLSHLGIEAARDLPSSCGPCLAVYGLDECRETFSQTAIIGEDAERVWTIGNHQGIGGYGSEESGQMAGMLSAEHFRFNLGALVEDVEWPEGWLSSRPFAVLVAKPKCRFPYKGDVAWVPLQ